MRDDIYRTLRTGFLKLPHNFKIQFLETLFDAMDLETVEDYLKWCVKRDSIINALNKTESHPTDNFIWTISECYYLETKITKNRRAILCRYNDELSKIFNNLTNLEKEMYELPPS